jgi:hypothetical protein
MIHRLHDPWRLWNQSADGLTPPPDAAAKKKAAKKQP